MDVEEDEKLANADLLETEAQESENDADLEDDEKSEESSDFVNPLAVDEEKEDEWSSDGEHYDTRVTEPKEDLGKKKQLPLKRQRGDLDDVQGFFKDNIEVVP